MKARSPKQNDSLHQYYEDLAEALNLAGLDMREVLPASIEIDWTKDMVKEYLWRPIQYAKLFKKSTKDLASNEIDKVYDVLNRHFSKMGIYVPFPNIEEQFNKRKNGNKNLQSNIRRNTNRNKKGL